MIATAVQNLGSRAADSNQNSKVRTSTCLRLTSHHIVARTGIERHICINRVISVTLYVTNALSGSTAYLVPHIVI